jgi:pyocin large subunit-like protein
MRYHRYGKSGREQTMNIRTLVFTGVAAAGLLGLSACDNGPSAVRTRDRADASTPRSDTTSVAREDDAARADRPRGQRRHEASPAEDDLGGGLRWAANSRHTAEDNAHYQFDKRGADFGIADFKAYVAKADAFVARPPEGVLKMERSNGDVLFYDPKSNIFAVADKAGAPRIMIRPPDGMAYWDAQKAREARRKPRTGDDGEKS